MSFKKLVMRIIMIIFAHKMRIEFLILERPKLVREVLKKIGKNPCYLTGPNVTYKRLPNRLSWFTYSYFENHENKKKSHGKIEDRKIFSFFWFVYQIGGIKSLKKYFEGVIKLYLIKPYHLNNMLRELFVSKEITPSDFNEFIYWVRDLTTDFQFSVFINTENFDGHRFVLGENRLFIFFLLSGRIRYAEILWKFLRMEQRNQAINRFGVIPSFCKVARGVRLTQRFLMNVRFDQMLSKIFTDGQIASLGQLAISNFYFHLINRFYSTPKDIVEISLQMPLKIFLVLKRIFGSDYSLLSRFFRQHFDLKDLNELRTFMSQNFDTQKDGIIARCTFCEKFHVTRKHGSECCPKCDGICESSTWGQIYPNTLVYEIYGLHGLHFNSHNHGQGCQRKKPAKPYEIPLGIGRGRGRGRGIFEMSDSDLGIGIGRGRGRGRGVPV